MRKINRIFRAVRNDFFGSLFWTIFTIRKKCHIHLFNNFIHLFCYINRVRIGKSVIFNGLPEIRRYPESEISIGDNCIVNSARKFVLLGYGKPCKFVTIRKDSRIIIGKNVGLSGVIIVSDSSIEISDNVMIGANSMIIDTDFHHSHLNQRHLESTGTSRPILIEENVFIGANCIVLKGVIIGENSVIGAGSVVVSNIPKNSIAIGNPCKLVIKKSFS
jgi:acetyltransferase-like isoleucine patch superfamily enzyme